jgi:arylsulfatase A-like enzyme
MKLKNSIIPWLGAWIAAPVTATYLSMNSMMRHESWQYAVEFVVFLTLGFLQFRYVQAKWLRSLLWPALAVVFAGLAANGPLDKTLWIVFYAIGLVSLIMHLMKDFQDTLQPRPAVAALLAVTAVIFLRYLDLAASTEAFGEATRHQTVSTVDRLIDDISPDRNNFTGDTADETPVIIISVDTLRADFAKNMSSWQRMASLGAWWDKSMSSSSWTLPAAASLVTGLAPSQHGAGCFADQCQGLDVDVPTIAQTLNERGYRTVAVTANPWITEETGFGRGVEHYLDFSGITPVRLSFAGLPNGPHPQDAERLVDEAIDLIGRLPDRGFFLWLHLIDPHMPYHHAERPEIRNVLASTIRTSPPSSESARSLVIDGYRGEVDHADIHLNRFLDALENARLLDTSIIVFTSDHGEEFWEHGDIEHGHSHHGEVIEVPLVLIGPDIQPGKREDVASIMDIVPTIRAVAGLDANGVDLRSPVPDDRIAYAYGNAHMQNARSARNSKVRVIVEGDLDLERPFIHAYDLLTDPGERMPWVPLPEDPVVQVALSIQPPALGKKALVNTENLKALGYLE